MKELVDIFKLKDKPREGIRAVAGIRWFFIFITLFSCDNNSKKNIDIYFFELDDLTTSLCLDCDSIEKVDGLLKLSVKNNEKLFDLLTDLDKNSEYFKYPTPDVRYKIVINKDIYCVGYTSIFVKNGNKTGRIKILNKIQEYIEMNKHKAVPITKPIEKPWLNYEGIRPQLEK